MKLNKKNYFARYYNYVCGEYPNDVCSFFWGSLLAIALSPLLLYGKLIMYHIYKRYNLRYGLFSLSFMGLVFYILTIAVIMVGNTALETWFGYEFIYWWSQILGGFLLGTLIFVIGLGLIISIVAFIVLK